jgi:dihydrofolate reductase
MTSTRKIIVQIATSADGYIARSDGDVGWLDRPAPKGNYGLNAFVKTIDTILWGHNTYLKGLELGMKLSVYGKGIRHYIFSRQPQPSPEPGVEFVNEPVSIFAPRLRSHPGKHIWMMGGSRIIASFLDENQIDEFLIHVIPVFIGEGIPLIAARRRTIPLKLLSSRSYPDGVVGLHFATSA